MFGGALILGLMAFVRNAEELVFLRAVQGLITGTVGAANALVAAAVPRERAGYAMGLLQVGLGCGVALGPVAGGLIADAYGYAAAFYVTSALLALAGFVVFFGVEERFTPPAETPGNPTGLWREWRLILSTPGVATTYCLRFINQMSRMIFVPILPLFALELIAEQARVNSFTGLVVGISAAAATLSAVFLGRFGDRAGHRRIVIGCCVCGGVSFALQTLSASPWLFLTLQVAAGMASGGIMTGVSALLAAYTRFGEEGAVYGLDNSISSGARAAAPMVGAAVALSLSLRAVFGAAAIFYLTAAALAIGCLPRTAAPKYA
jgi:DHA1 family multidrug resistance protein-like MFS transporter